MRLYMKYFSMHLRAQMQYKASFVLLALGQFLVSFNVFLGIYFMFQRFHKVKDFTYPQIMLCFAIVLIAFSLAECIFRGFDTFPSMLGNGEFDRILVRPRSTMLQVLGSKVEFTRIGRLLQAIVMFIYGISSMDMAWTWDKILLVFFMILSGMVIFASLFILYAGICFFTLEGLEVFNIVTDGAREYGKYPVAVYGKNVLKFCTYIVPFALFQYYPFLYLIGYETNPIYFLYPILACTFFLPCFGVWRFGLHRYRSTGS